MLFALLQTVKHKLAQKVYVKFVPFRGCYHLLLCRKSTIAYRISLYVDHAIGHISGIVIG